MGPLRSNLRCLEASHSGRRFSRTRRKDHRVHASLRHVHTGSPDQLLEALVAYSNVLIADGPPQVYLKLSAIDAAAPQGNGVIG